MPFFQSDDISFHYQSEGTGMAVLFLHGLGGNMEQSRKMLQHVSSIRKVFMDVRGHGQTALGPPTLLNFSRFAQDAMALMRHLGIDRFIAGGISMGSGIALNLALTFPRHVEGLVLIRPAWLNTPYPENLKEHVMIGKLLKDQSPEQAKRSFMESKEYGLLVKLAPAVAQSLLGQFDVSCAGDLAERLIRIPGSVPFEAVSDLSMIHVDTLIIATEHDSAHPLIMAEELASRIPRSSLAKVTSKSEDMGKYFSECARYVDSFVKVQRFTHPTERG